MGHGANPRTEIDAIVRELLIRLDDKGILSVPILLSSHPATPANLRGLAQPPNDLIHRLRRRARSSHSSAGTPHRSRLSWVSLLARSEFGELVSS
jgi:hypothetical protein